MCSSTSWDFDPVAVKAMRTMYVFVNKPCVEFKAWNVF